MLGSLLGFFGIVRPGALIEQEEMAQIDAFLAQLKQIPNWAHLVATSVAPVEEQKRVEDSLLMFEYRVKRTKEDAPISHLRYFAHLLEKIVEIAQRATPAVAPTVASVMVSALTPSPAVESAAAPPIPPGLICPYYTRESFEAPANWDDPAAAQRYLDKYPDVKKAVVDLQVQPSAIWHYRCHGQKEGRTWAGLSGIRRPGFLRGR